MSEDKNKGKEKEKRPVECSIEYITGREGYYVRKSNPLFTAVVRVGTNPEMDPVTEELTYHGKKIPGNVFRQWLTFGREVAAKAKGNSEAGLILFYHPTECTWGAFPPKQDLSSVSVDFTGVTDCIGKFREEHGKEWLMAGTLHTHPGDAGPSSIDVDDEKKLDGIHLIVPDFGRGADRGINCHIVCSGERFVVKKPVGFLIDWDSEEGKASIEVPDSWLTQVKFGRPSSKAFGYSGEGYSSGYYGGHSGYGNSEHIFKGQGPKMHKATVNGVDINLVGEIFEVREIKAVLKRLGFTNGQRKFLLSNFEDDMEDILIAFDKAREALKFSKEICGTVSDHEHGEIVEKIADATTQILESLVTIAERMLESAGKGSGVDDGVKEDAGEEDIKEESPSIEKSVGEFDHRDIS